MKMIYAIIVLALIGGIIFYLVSRKKESQSNELPSQQNENKNIDAQKPVGNPYQDLRNIALATTPEQLNLKISENKTEVYGIVMDWNTGKGIATFVAFRTGDASMYTSTGGGVLGGGFHENVKRAALAFIEKAQTKLNNTTKTEATPLPDERSVKFYFLTNKGKFVADEQMKNFENNSSEWLELFEEGNKIVTELRLTSESQQFK